LNLGFSNIFPALVAFDPNSLFQNFR